MYGEGMNETDLDSTKRIDRIINGTLPLAVIISDDPPRFLVMENVVDEKEVPSILRRVADQIQKELAENPVTGKG